MVLIPYITKQDSLLFLYDAASNRRATYSRGEAKDRRVFELINQIYFMDENTIVRPLDSLKSPSSRKKIELQNQSMFPAILNSLNYPSRQLHLWAYLSTNYQIKHCKMQSQSCCTTTSDQTSFNFTINRHYSIP